MRDYLRAVVWPLLMLSACADSGVEVGLASEELLADGPIETISLNLTADTSIRSGLLSTNRNYGTANALDLDRSLVIVEQGTLKPQLPNSDYVESAKLRFTLAPSLRLLPRTLSAHRVLKAWTEGGATWNCAIDSNPGNLSTDCSGATRWTAAGGDFVAQATGTTTVAPLRTGVIEIDVTEDVRKFKNDINTKNYGWLLRANLGSAIELGDLASKESANKPQLIVQIRRCGGPVICNDGILCSQEVIGYDCDDGVCQRVNAPHITDCDDGDPCTIADHCSGVDFGCVSETPAPAGTECGNGGTCDGAGNCEE
jgi:hypothetical protein